MRMQYACLRAVALSCLLLVLNACASAPQSAALLTELREDDRSAFSSPVTLHDVPFFPQEDYQCGPAALATVLHASAVNVTPDELVPLVYVPARQGSLQLEMLAAARTHGRIAYPLPPSLNELLREVQAGRPVLVMQNLGLSWYPNWHYAVVVGYDLSRRELILRSGTIRDYRVSLSVFERTWRRSEHWAVVVLQPGEMPVAPQQAAYFQAVASFERVNSTPEVIEAYQAGLRVWPDEPYLGMGLANLLYAQNDFAAAALALQDLLRHNPDFAVGHNNLAHVLLALGKTEQAFIHASTAIELGGEHQQMFESTFQRVQQQLEIASEQP